MTIILVLCGAIELSFHWKKTKMCYVLIQDIKYTFGFNLKWRLRFVICVFVFFFFFFFFLVQPVIVDLSIVNSASVHCSRIPQITIFNNFFIKNRSHSTIYTFKNYFATVLSVSAKIAQSKWTLNCFLLEAEKSSYLC